MGRMRKLVMYDRSQELWGSGALSRIRWWIGRHACDGPGLPALIPDTLPDSDELH